MGIKVVSTGHALPSQCITNEALSQKIETSDEWIQTRTGIKQRYFCADHEDVLTLSKQAAEMALETAGLKATDIDAIFLATTSPNLTFPAVAVQLQAALGMTKGFAFDLQAACSGFIYGLSTAENYLRSGKIKRALVVGAEALSRIINMEDRTTSVLFGDGAGAVLLAYDDTPDEGLLDVKLYSDGRYKDLLCATGGVGAVGDIGYLSMRGKEVFKFATRTLAGLVEDMLSSNNIKQEEIDWLVPHQANKRIIEATAKHISLPMEKVVLTVDCHANTSSASIPLALSESIHSGKIKRGETLLLEAFGGGFTWGAALLKY